MCVCVCVGGGGGGWREESQINNMHCMYCIAGVLRAPNYKIFIDFNSVCMYGSIKGLHHLIFL